ncbi:uncharacterized protein PG986_005631 [Apiospora aurea]|uniref:Nucleoside phosphorylase domain-containing protein n=1 Tax=Apiospora aurea TaxID=335848 RepID=A0ABR1QI35_9PEZI
MQPDVPDGSSASAPSPGVPQSFATVTGQNDPDHGQARDTATALHSNYAAAPAIKTGANPAPSSFDLAIITALDCEFNAVIKQLDEFDASTGELHDSAKFYTSSNILSFLQGHILGHPLLLAKLVGPGDVDASRSVQYIAEKYPELRLVLVVGVCAGVAKPVNTNISDIYIGDVIIGSHILSYAKGALFTPEEVKMREMSLQGSSDMKIQSLLGYLRNETLLGRVEKRLNERVTRPSEPEKPFPADYHHFHRGKPCSDGVCNPQTGRACEGAFQALCSVVGCEDDRRLDRPGPDSGRIHIRLGPYASAPMIMRDPTRRDQLAERFGVLAFEMELGGVWDFNMPVVPIKGVCDYADSHKNKSSQQFAADTAACVMRMFVGGFLGTG